MKTTSTSLLAGLATLIASGWFACGSRQRGDSVVLGAGTPVEVEDVLDSMAAPKVAQLIESDTPESSVPDSNSTDDVAEATAAVDGPPKGVPVSKPPLELPGRFEGSALFGAEEWERMRSELAAGNSLESLAGMRVIEGMTSAPEVEALPDRSEKGKVTEEDLLDAFQRILWLRLRYDEIYDSGNPYKIEKREAEFRKELDEIVASISGLPITLDFEVVGLTYECAVVRWSALPMQILPPDLVVVGIAPKLDASCADEVVMSRTELTTAVANLRGSMTSFIGVDGPMHSTAMLARIGDWVADANCTLKERLIAWAALRADGIWSNVKDLYMTARYNPLALVGPAALQIMRSPGIGSYMDEMQHPSCIVARAWPNCGLAWGQLQELEVGDTVQLQFFVNGYSLPQDINSLPVVMKSTKAVARRVVVLDGYWVTEKMQPPKTAKKSEEQGPPSQPVAIDGEWHYELQDVMLNGRPAKDWRYAGLFGIKREGEKIGLEVVQWTTQGGAVNIGDGLKEVSVVQADMGKVEIRIEYAWLLAEQAGLGDAARIVETVKLEQVSKTEFVGKATVTVGGEPDESRTRVVRLVKSKSAASRKREVVVQRPSMIWLPIE